MFFCITLFMFFLLLCFLTPLMYLGQKSFVSEFKLKFKIEALYFIFCILTYLFFAFILKRELFGLLFLSFIPFTPRLLSFLLHYFLEKKNRKKQLEDILVFIEICLISLKQGRSFQEALFKNQSILGRNHNVRLIIKKNVVLQQPKSRSFLIFSLFEDSLQKIYLKKIGQKELLTQLKTKYTQQIQLEEKLKIALSQYHAQSFVIFIFWIAALIFLILQELHQEYALTILLSFALLLLGKILSKKLLVLSEFHL